MIKSSIWPACSGVDYIVSGPPVAPTGLEIYEGSTTTLPVGVLSQPRQPPLFGVYAHCAIHSVIMLARRTTTWYFTEDFEIYSKLFRFWIRVCLLLRP